MLTMTANAAVAVKGVAAALDLPETGGLRVSREAGREIELVPAEHPRANEKVVERLGARVFVPSGTAAAVEDAVLDARVAAGAIRFSVRDPALAGGA
jgi:iron-sulfur cluster assembly protein